jgi:hypothetical protein
VTLVVLQSLIEVPGASHAALVSHPDETANLTLKAAASRVAARPSLRTRRSCTCPP